MVRDIKKFNVETLSKDENNKLKYLSRNLTDDPNTVIHNILSVIYNRSD